MNLWKNSIILLLALTALAAGQHRRDPLTETEADQLRDMRMEPLKRLKLYIKFTDARLDSIDQLRNDPKQADGRAAKIHDLLQDVAALLDEINDNLDTYEDQVLDKDQHKQFRKGVQDVVEATGRWDERLKVLRNAMQMDPQAKAESHGYVFALQDAEDALKSCADVAREYAAEKDKDEGKGDATKK